MLPFNFNVNFHPTIGLGQQYGLFSDLVTLNSDGSGSTLHSNKSITWENDESSLTIVDGEERWVFTPMFHHNRQYLSYVERFENDELTQVYVHDISPAQPANDISLITQLPQMYAIGINYHFTDFWQDQNTVKLENVWGYQFRQHGHLRRGIAGVIGDDEQQDFYLGQAWTYEREANVVTMSFNDGLLNRTRQWHLLSSGEDGRILVYEYSTRRQDLNNDGEISENEIGTYIAPRINTLMPTDISKYQEAWDRVPDTDSDGLKDVQEIDLGTDPERADTDGDGFNDLQDVFPLDQTEWLDTDNDGAGNNVDQDDDNDGIFDEDDIAPLDPTIGDDEAPVFVDLSELVVEATAPQTQITLEQPVVTDNNRFAPTVTHNLTSMLALGEHEVLWIATDYAGNVTTAIQVIRVVDTTAPDFGDLATLVLPAYSEWNDISASLSYTAVDLVDLQLSVDVSGETRLRSGLHSLTLSATDLSGNTQTAELNVHLQPVVQSPKALRVERGGSYQVPISLIGEAAEYPVTVDYKLVNGSDEVELSKVEINAGTQGTLMVNVPDSVQVGDDVSLTFIAADNAVLPESDDLTVSLTVVDTNYAPTMRVVLSQEGELRNLVDREKGNVKISVEVNDVNASNNHQVSFVIDNVSDLNIDGSQQTFEFDPSTLTSDAETISIDISVTEINTDEAFEVSQTLAWSLVSLPELSSTEDSDGDGINDAQEGFSDEDGDGIPQYLDSDNNPSRLPLAVDSVIQTEQGLQMQLGSIVLYNDAASASNASLTEENLEAYAKSLQIADSVLEDVHYQTESKLLNFIVSNIETTGESIDLVIPLSNGEVLPPNAIYRKWSPESGWFTFVENAGNVIMSGIKDKLGNCPSLNDISAFSAGLTTGHNCVRLTIEDGGPNDMDGEANGIVHDPGKFAVELANQLPVIQMSAPQSVDEGQSVILDASGTTDAESDKLVFSWQQSSGTNVELTLSEQGKVATFKAPDVAQDMNLEFVVTVNDGRDSVTQTVIVIVKQVEAPVVDTPPVEKKKSSGGAMGTLILFILFAGIRRKYYR
ncbi:hypothetical protein SOPP22_05920 [Shewanella sp. OPT22]|nr:hypothetical protein SOPP22_05920 [Shewanella sp. OPT22]